MEREKRKKEKARKKLRITSAVSLQKNSIQDLFIHEANSILSNWFIKQIMGIESRSRSTIFLIVKQFLIEVLLDRDSFISRVQLGWLEQ